MNLSTSKRQWISAIARIGFVGKGIVYFMVGLLAMQAAIGMKAQATGTQQALQEFIFPPFGSIFLIACAVGLLAHAIWKIVQSIFDPVDRRENARVVVLRIVDFLTALLYISLSYAAWQILRGLNTQSSSQQTEVWVANVLKLPYGKWIVMLFAAIITIAGFYQFYAAYTAHFDAQFDKSRMNSQKQHLLRQLGRIGFSAWGIVYLMLGFLFYQAAIYYNANQAGGLADSLNALRAQPYGIWILGITSGGLLIYSLYLLTLSYYHKVFEN